MKPDRYRTTGTHRSVRPAMIRVWVLVSGRAGHFEDVCGFAGADQAERGRLTRGQRAVVLDIGRTDLNAVLGHVRVPGLIDGFVTGVGPCDGPSVQVGPGCDDDLGLETVSPLIGDGVLGLAVPRRVGG